MYAFQGALTWQHTRVTCEAFEKYKCTDLMSRDSSSLGLLWGQGIRFLQQQGTVFGEGIGAPAASGDCRESRLSFSRWVLSEQRCGV